ncbi:hypothetical protein LguiB_005868 [Lonicera macranthoides]
MLFDAVSGTLEIVGSKGDSINATSLGTPQLSPQPQALIDSKRGEYRCLSNLGPCSIKYCNEDCCKRKCKSYFNFRHPEGYCDEPIGYRYIMCYCYHDCQT